MGNQRVTNVLLFLILVMLVANLFVRFEPKAAIAMEASVIENALTENAGDQPGAYLHVVTHTAVAETTTPPKSWR